MHLAVMVKVTCLNEKKAQLADAKEDITRLRSQLVYAPIARDHAFAYGYGVGVLRLRSHLITNLSTDLMHLDPNLFKPEATSCYYVDKFGRTEMPNTFTDIPSPPSPFGVLMHEFLCNK